MNNNKIQLLNIELDNLSPGELLEQFDSGFLVTPNVDHLIKLQKNQAFYEAYESAQFKVCDSRILFLLIRLLFSKNRIKSQITGSDFFPQFCQYHAIRKSGTSVFLLGGTTSSVMIARANINHKTQSEIIADGYSPPFGFEHNDEETNKIIELINDSQADTLAVGVGAPKQELWIQKNRHRMPHVRRFLAIGATIEFESGNLTRAPKWLTNIGLEWLFRLSQEPKRLIKRYLIEDIPIFLYILKQRLGLYKNPWE